MGVAVAAVLITELNGISKDPPYHSDDSSFSVDARSQCGVDTAKKKRCTSGDRVGAAFGVRKLRERLGDLSTSPHLRTLLRDHPTRYDAADTFYDQAF